MIEAAIYKCLTTDTALVAAVADRVYPNRAPKEVIRPFIVFQQVAGFETQGGFGETHSVEQDFVFFCYPPLGFTSGNYRQGKVIARAIRLALRDIQLYNTELNVCIINARLVAQKDDYETQTEQHGVVQRFAFTEQD